MNEEVVASFSGVSKQFGRVEALRGLTLEIPAGSVVGLLGRNGAGKSTALRALVGLLVADAGVVRVLDRDPLALDVGTRQRIGYVSDDGVPFLTATTERLIRMCAPLYPSWSGTLQDQMLARFQIDPRRKLKDMSMGQQRAVALLLAVCPQPELLILDEPAANLDPVVRRDFLDLILSMVGDNRRTVIFSSHMLSDVERVADRVAILHQGSLLVHSALDELKENARRLRFVFEGRAPDGVPLPGAFAVRRAGRELIATVIDYDGAAASRAASALGARVEANPLGLDELFVDLVGHRAADDPTAAGL